jgi:hypothetical protein
LLLEPLEEVDDISIWQGIIAIGQGQQDCYVGVGMGGVGRGMAN